jgi:DNA repair photolyase
MGVRAGRCIDHHRLEQLYGGAVSRRVDGGQRRSAGCGCHQSVDIGSYRLHPCRHNCLYCYANPVGGENVR